MVLIDTPVYFYQTWETMSSFNYISIVWKLQVILLIHVLFVIDNYSNNKVFELTTTSITLPPITSYVNKVSKGIHKRKKGSVFKFTDEKERVLHSV